MPAFNGAASQPLTLKCDEIVSRSFPPNLNWINFGVPGFDAHNFATFAPGQWVEYIIQIPAPGTYEIHADLKGGNSSGLVELFVNGESQGEPLDLFSTAPASIRLSAGKYTFLKAGKAIFRFTLKGKNSQSQGFTFDLESVTLTPTDGFKLISPEGACCDERNPVLQWENLGPGTRYSTFVDNIPLPVTENTSCEAKHLNLGDHDWYVIAQDPAGKKQRSNRFHFRIGPALPYPDRDFSDDFSSGDLSGYRNDGMAVSSGPLPGKKSLTGPAPSTCACRDIQLGVWEGEVSASLALEEQNSCAAVGFTHDDGTKICAVLNGETGTLSLERTVAGYSIFTITPAAYRLAQWKESQDPKGAYTWQISSQPIVVKPGTAYRLKLAYSRRSNAVMATLTESDGSNPITLRDLIDINTPDHPMVAIAKGKARFDQFTYRRLNRLVYPWDIDTNQIVLRPGPPGSWDSHGAFNSAIVVKNNLWYMVYRGNVRPAPPTGPASSSLGVATSEDGVHWTKDSHNPILATSPSQGTVEDPDLLVPEGTDTYHLEYVILRPRNYVPKEAGVHEMVATSTDGIHYSEPWRLSVHGKIGGMIDTHNAPTIPEFASAGKNYRYLAFIEEGGVYASNDLHEWDKMGVADLAGQPDHWCNYHECAGDIFVDADHNIRLELQAGVDKRTAGNRLCTNVEDVISGSDPTKVIWRGDLPWLPDYYGEAPTGDLNEMTFTNGSVFPGQTIIKDGYLWHYYGGNNTYAGLIKSVYQPVFSYRNLHVTYPSETPATAHVEVTIRNEGSFGGKTTASLLLDGKPLASRAVSLDRDEEKNVEFSVKIPMDLHWLATDSLRASLRGKGL